MEDERKYYEEENNIGCTESCYKDISVGIPVTIKPIGKVGDAKIHCLESCVVFDNVSECTKSMGEWCKLVIVQKLRVEIPVMFGADVEAEEAFIDCGCNESKCKSYDCHDYECESETAEFVEETE